MTSKSISIFLFVFSKLEAGLATRFEPQNRDTRQVQDKYLMKLRFDGRTRRFNIELAKLLLFSTRFAASH